MSSSTSSLILSLLATGIFGYSLYHMNYDPQLKKMVHLIPVPLRAFGQLKFLTFQCLLIQFLNALLHVGAHFLRPLRKPRDLIFTALAYPVGAMVVYTFWGVWHLMGRDAIFPEALDLYYPNWLNHATHSIIAPLNILLAVTLNHNYSKHSVKLCLFYMIGYTLWLHYIKMKTGLFVYKYLETMGDIERIIYFIGTGLFIYVLFKSGQLLTNFVHKQAAQRPAMKKKQK